MGRDREQLQRILGMAVAQSSTRQIVSAEDFLALLKNRDLAGSQEFSKNAQSVITDYVKANLAGGKLLETYVAQTFAYIPDSEFGKPIHPETDITLGDAVNMAQYAIARWSVIVNDKNSIAKLPLAV